MNPNDIIFGMDVLISEYTYKWSYVPAKVVRATKTWIIVKRLHDGAPLETFKKSNLRELNAGLTRENDLIIDPVKIKECLDRQEQDKARSILVNKSAAILDNLRNNIRSQSDETLNKIISLVEPLTE